MKINFTPNKKSSGNHPSRFSYPTHFILGYAAALQVIKFKKIQDMYFINN